MSGSACERPPSRSGVSVWRVPGGYRFAEQGQEILTYNRDPIAHSDGSHARGHYVHPLYGLDGQRMTDDMPRDHLHHRGVFWAWTQLWIGEQRIGHPWEQRDLVWDVSDVKIWNEGETAVLRATVTWRSRLWVDQRKRTRPIVAEIATIRVHPASDTARNIDFEIELLAATASVRLGGSRNTKGYGGFSVRIPLPKDLGIFGHNGEVAPDWKKPSAPQAWVDFSAKFGGLEQASGITVMCHPSTAGFPQGWTIRRAGSCQNPVYPGQQPVALSMTKPLLLRYRLVLHRGGFDAAQSAARFESYTGKKH